MITSHITFETDDVIRIDLRRDVIKTCVFLISDRNGREYSMIDTGLDETTTREQLLPAIKRLRIPLESIKTLLITHSHFDHVGGLESVLSSMPHLEVFAAEKLTPTTKPLSDGFLFGDLQAIALPGHSLDGYGFLDLRTNSLLSGDAIQAWGVGDFGVSAESPEKYLESHEKLLKMHIENVFSSHYYDFSGIRAIGKSESTKFIEESKKNYVELIDFVHNQLAKTDNPREICKIFERLHPDYPKMQAGAIERIINYIKR